MVLLPGRRVCLAVWLACLSMAQEKPPAPPPVPEAKPADTSKRVELNLLGKTDTAAGESRRNENIQFNLVDNNALKELNVRLGTTATIVGEFQPARSYFGSEFGVAPSAVLHVAPGGTLGFHGDLHYGHQNSIFSARSFFQVGDVKPAKQNEFGFSLRTPLWRGGYLQLDGAQDRQRGNVNGNVLVPQPDERTALSPDPAKRALINRWLAAYPAEPPNRTDVNPRALNTNSPQTIDSTNGGVRLDQDLGSRDRLALLYQFTAQSVEAFQLVTGQNPDTDTKSHRARVTWNRQWSPATITDFSAGFDRIGSLLVPEANAVGPMVSITGLQTLGPLAGIPIDRAQNLYRYAGQIRQTRGRHNWSAGFDLLRRQFNGIESDAHRGFFSFGNDFGRTGIENFRLGIPSQHLIAIGHIARGFRGWEMQFYGGDNWKLRSDLTLNIGLRYQPSTRPVEVNRFNEIPYGGDWNNFGPEFGLAWRMPRRWGLLRTAYGIQYGQIFPITYSQVRFSPPWSVKIAGPAPDLLDPLGGGNRADALGNLYLLDPWLATPYSHQYNFSWEPSLSSNWRLQFGYVGSRSHKLLIMWYLNRAHPVEGIPQTTATINRRRRIPDLAEIRWVLNGSRGYFDAGRATLIAPRWHGLTLDVSYWWSKAMDLGSSYTNTAYDADSRLSRSQSEFETHRDRRGLSSFDQTHAFLSRGSYEFAGRPGWLGRLGGGWRVSAVLLWKSGTPFTVSTPDGPGFGNVDGNGGDRPNLLDPSILGRTIGQPDTSQALLPRSAFTFMQPSDEGGNLGVNTFRKGGIANVNASLSRTWTVAADKRLTFRAESINLSNTPQFAEPGSELSSPNFGQITNTLNDGRTFRFVMQFGW